MKRFLSFSAYATLAMAMVLVIYILYLLFYPFKPIKLNVQPNVVLTPVVEVGGDVIWTFDYCRRVENPSILYRTIRGPRTYHVDPITTVGKTGCHLLQVVTPLPEDIAPGDYYLHTVNNTRVNQLRVINTVHETEYFKVVEKGTISSINN